MASKFFVTKSGGEIIEVEARSLSGALKKGGSEAIAVALVKPAPTSWCSLVEESIYSTVTIAFPWDGEMTASVEAANGMFAAMGYGPITIKTNMMSGKEYIEAVGTPRYCSPSSEAYWSM